MAVYRQPGTLGISRSTSELPPIIDRKTTSRVSGISTAVAQRGFAQLAQRSWYFLMTMFVLARKLFKHRTVGWLLSVAVVKWERPAVALESLWNKRISIRESPRLE